MSEVPSVAPSTPAPQQAAPQQANQSPSQSEQKLSGDSSSQEVSDAQEMINDVENNPKASKAEKKAAEALKKKYNLKVNGKEQSVELDLSDDKAIERYLQKAMAADEKFQEAATLRKDVQLLVKTLKENPMAILTHPDIGIDVKKLAEQVINQELDDMAKSPEQKRIEELERKIKEKEDRERQLEDEKRAAELAKREEEYFHKIDDDITEALSTSELPKVPYVVKRISDTMIAAFDMGYHDVTVKDIMPIVEKQLNEELGGFFDSSKEEVIEKLLGKNLDRVRKKRLASAKKAMPTAQQAIKDTGANSKPKETNKEEKKQRFEDLFGKF